MTTHRWLYRSSLALVVCTFFLLIAGGMVTSTGSGLSVPDWPLSYGQLMPPMVGGIFYEHGHRMIATFVGMLTVIVVGWIWRKEDRDWLKWTAAVSLLLVIVQGVLGGLTVLFLLPTAISAAHATIAQTFFCLTILIAFSQSEWWRSRAGKGDIAVHPSVVILPFIVVFVQLVLGALMRHSQAGLAIPDYPLSFGRLFPSFTSDALSEYSARLAQEGIRSPLDPPVTAWQIGIHTAHRFWAIATALTVAWFGWKTRTYGNLEPRFRFLGNLLIGLVVIQFSLGILTVLTRKDVILTTAHQSTGALVLGAVALTVFHLLRLGPPVSILAQTHGQSR